MIDQHKALWPQGQARRVRQPAGLKPQDIRKASSIKRRLQLTGNRDQKTSAVRQQRSQKQSHEQFYRHITETGWQQDATHTGSRHPLFGQSPAASTAALRAKLCPAFDTTKDWTRVQRKLLPKYLFVLDAVTAVHVLQCLVRLQPLSTCNQHRGFVLAHREQHETLKIHSGQRADVAQASHMQGQHHQQQQQQQQQQGPNLDQIAQLPTSIYGAMVGPQPCAWPAATPTHAQLSAADAAAVAKGFTNAAAAREDFDLMLAAVYTVLAAKLVQWPLSVLTKVLSCAGQLQLQHQGFLQAWLAASQPQLAQQSAATLFSCAEALSRLQAQPPQPWWLEWQQAMQGQLDQLSLTQLTALQLHLLHLQQQRQQQQEEAALADSWWADFQSALVHKLSDSSHKQPVQQAELQATSTGASVCSQSPPAPAAAAAQSASVAVAAGVPAPGKQKLASIDALCTILSTCHLLLGTPPPQQWVSSVLQLCTDACQQGSVSTAGALQLLTACCYGCCRQQEGAAAAQAASLRLLQLRMLKLPSPLGVAVLFACLQSGQVAEQVPAGFAEALGARLTELLPSLPTDLVLEVPHVLATVEWQQEERLLAAFALTTQARLAKLGPGQVQRLLQGCIDVKVVNMPAVWCDAVLQRLQQLGPVEAGAGLVAAMRAGQRPPEPTM